MNAAFPGLCGGADVRGLPDAVNAYWQIDYDRRTNTYEAVFNVEVFQTTDFAFGVHPSQWAVGWDSCVDSDSDGVRRQDGQLVLSWPLHLSCDFTGDGWRGLLPN